MTDDTNTKPKAAAGAKKTVAADSTKKTGTEKSTTGNMKKTGTGAKASVSDAAKSPVKRRKKITGPTIAVFIDIENTNASSDNLLELFTTLKTKGTITYGKLYGYRFDKAANYDEIVAENRLETVGRMRYKHGDDSVIDTRLIMDCILAAQSRKYTNVFIWAGVGDLMSLFAHVKQLGCKIMTVDLPAFDNANKFVDQKIKLFSPHTLSKPTPVAAVSPTAAYQAAAAPPPARGTANTNPDSVADAILADKTIPQLPRKEGAPDFTKKTGEHNSFGAIADDDNADDDTDGSTDDDMDFDDEDLEDFDDAELDEINKLLAERGLSVSADPDDIDDAELSDFDDLGGDIEEADYIIDPAADRDDLDTSFTASVNEKIRALSMQLMKDVKRGKKFDLDKASARYDKDYDDFGRIENADENRNAYYNAATQYDEESSQESPADKQKPEREGENDLDDFGNL